MVGAPRRLTPAQQALASDPRHLRLAEGIAAKFGKRFPPLADEFEAAAPVALCEAAATFDPAVGVRFATHATGRIEGAMRDTCREWTAKGFRRRAEDAPLVGTLEHPIGHDDEGDPRTLAESIAAGEEPVGWEAEFQDELEGLARRLPGRLGEAIRLLYGRADLVTMKAAGVEIGLCETRISQMHSIAAELLAERFPNSEEMFMAGRMSRFLEPTRIGPDSIRVDDVEASRVPEPAGVSPDEAAPNGRCPDCGKPYGKYRRCFVCTPCKPRVGPYRPAATTDLAVHNGHVGVTVAKVEAPAPTAEPIRAAPAATATVRRADPPPAWLESARAELRAMEAVLTAVEGIGDPDAARRVLAWAAGRIG
jgi:DNA-directed RNA polymerase specialized sigma subunit